MITGTPGILSYGTDHTEDLIAVLAPELKRLADLNPDAHATQIARDVLGGIAEFEAHLATLPDGDPKQDWLDGEAAQDVIAALVECLSRFSPEGHYFGTQNDDEADYGFHPAGADIMTFGRWQATRVQLESVSEYSGDSEPRPGYLYDGSRFIWIADKDGAPFFHTILHEYPMGSTDLEEVERELYQWCGEAGDFDGYKGGYKL